jgi:hypothetical protein
MKKTKFLLKISKNHEIFVKFRKNGKNREILKKSRKMEIFYEIIKNCEIIQII